VLINAENGVSEQDEAQLQQQRSFRDSDIELVNTESEVSEQDVAQLQQQLYCTTNIAAAVVGPHPVRIPRFLH
jgi:NACalpha-BTF3-like transcription factor